MTPIPDSELGREAMPAVKPDHEGTAAVSTDGCLQSATLRVPTTAAMITELTTTREAMTELKQGVEPQTEALGKRSEQATASLNLNSQAAGTCTESDAVVAEPHGQEGKASKPLVGTEMNKQQLQAQLLTYLAVTKGETPDVDESTLAQEQELFAQTDLGQFEQVLALQRRRQRDGDVCDERGLAVLHKAMCSDEHQTASDSVSQLGTLGLLDGPAQCQIFGLTRASFPSWSKKSDSTWRTETAQWIVTQLNRTCPGLLDENSILSIRVTIAPRPAALPRATGLRQQNLRTGPDTREAKVTLRLNEHADRAQLFMDRITPFCGTDCTALRVSVRPVAEGKRVEVALSSTDSQLLLALGRSLRLSPAQLEHLIADGAFNQLSCCLGHVLVRIGPAEDSGSAVPDPRVFVQVDCLTLLNRLHRQDLCLRLGKHNERLVELHFALPELSMETLQRLSSVHLSEILGSDRTGGNCLVVGPLSSEDIAPEDEKRLQVGLQNAIPTGAVQLLKSLGHSTHGFFYEFDSAEAASAAKMSLTQTDRHLKGKPVSQLLRALRDVQISFLPTITQINLPPVLCRLITKDQLYSISKSQRKTSLPSQAESLAQGPTLPASNPSGTGQP